MGNADNRLVLKESGINDSKLTMSCFCSIVVVAGGGLHICSNGTDKKRRFYKEQDPGFWQS